jgi:hypothetical protein
MRSRNTITGIPGRIDHKVLPLDEAEPSKLIQKCDLVRRPPVPRIVERLRRMLAWDEWRRSRDGAWPPPITLPKLGGDSPPWRS